jgi:hypothetical protein
MWVTRKFDGETWFLVRQSGHLFLASPTGKVIAGDIPTLKQADNLPDDSIVAGELFARLTDRRERVGDLAAALAKDGEDAADGIVAATLSDNTENKTYNITKSHSVTLLNAAQLAIKLAGGGTLIIKNKDADFPSRGSLNIDAARRDFEFNPKVDVEEGFNYYYEWLSTSKYWQAKIPILNS